MIIFILLKIIFESAFIVKAYTYLKQSLKINKSYYLGFKRYLGKNEYWHLKNKHLFESERLNFIRSLIESCFYFWVLFLLSYSLYMNFIILIFE